MLENRTASYHQSPFVVNPSPLICLLSQSHVVLHNSFHGQTKHTVPLDESKLVESVQTERIDKMWGKT